MAVAGMSRQEVARGLIFATVLFAVSGVGVFFPRNIQSIAIRTTKPEAMKSFFQSTGYLLLVRVVGICFLAMGLLVIWAMFWAPGDVSGL
jgi:hypothetical protein